MKRAKIVCTIGPASQDAATLDRLVATGMDVARLNMSHGSRQEHAEVAARIREASRKARRPIAILQDLSGPKIRLRELEKPLRLTVGDEVTLTSKDLVGTGTLLPVDYDGLEEELSVGDRLSMADGLLLLEVKQKTSSGVLARVLSDGVVSSHKGVALPSGATKLQALTPKDCEDLKFGLELDVDWVALSFVRTADDIKKAHEIMDAAGHRLPILAKIEKNQALDNIDAILDAFDGLMVARGDLGVEIPLSKVPEIQKDLIRRANAACKPVVTATQMLLSMVGSPRPTRAEVTDVSNAILDGSDGVMLSEESAIGAYPIDAVGMMARIAERAEHIRPTRAPSDGEPGTVGLPTAIARSTWHVARQVGARLIITPTVSGSTARLVAATRPEVPVLALSHVEKTVTQLCMTWGVVPRAIKSPKSTDELFDVCRREALDSGLAHRGERVVVTAGLPIEVHGTTNVLRVLTL